MPNTIKVKRGKSAALNTSTEKLQAGEVLYNLDKNYLTVGAEDNDALTKKPVAAREIVGYTGDTDSKIGASTTEAYSIRYNDDSGVVVSSENNILSTPGTLKMQTPGKNASTVIINTGEVDSDGSAKPTIELSTSLSMPITLALPWKSGTLATTDDITTSIATKLDNTNKDEIALKNNKSLSYTSDAVAYNIMSRDANGRARVADGVADKDIATVGQLNAGLNDKYTKPTGGIPKSDLASAVQASLEKADSALQSHQSITTGSVNGTIAANGTDVAVKGLGSLAYKNALTKADVGLGNVDNTSDEEKPISTATQAALDKKQASLTATQLNAVNSGITAGKVSTYDGYQSQISDKYTKPTNGIPETDLAGDVQTSLAKANSALQSHQTVKLESGTNNGTLKLTVNGTATDNIAVTNLGSAAFTAASNYATAAELSNYYTKTESDNRYVKSSENFVKAFTIPNGASSGTLTADVKQKLCNPDGHNYYVFDDTSEMILKYSFNEDDEIIQYKAIYLQNDKAYDITMQILPSNGSWRRSQTILNGATANPTLTGTEAELTGITIGGTDYKIPVTKEYVDDGFVKKQTGVSDRLYSIDSTGQDNVLGYSQSPANSAIVQYTSSGTVRTNTPIDNLDSVNKQYGDSKYFNKAEIELTPTTGDTVSKEQLQDLDTGLYGIFGHKIYGLDNSGYFNLEVFHSAGYRTYLLELSSNDMYMAQILNDTDRTFTGWVQLATTSDINNKKIFSVTIYAAGD